MVPIDSIIMRLCSHLSQADRVPALEEIVWKIPKARGLPPRFCDYVREIVTVDPLNALHYLQYPLTRHAEIEGDEGISAIADIVLNQLKLVEDLSLYDISEFVNLIAESCTESSVADKALRFLIAQFGEEPTVEWFMRYLTDDAEAAKILAESIGGDCGF